MDKGSFAVAVLLVNSRMYGSPRKKHETKHETKYETKHELEEWMTHRMLVYTNLF